MSDTRVVTLGCRLNAFESEVMRAAAREAGLADTVIVNTCAVTGEAERQSRQTIRRVRRQQPGSTIIVTGCAAQVNPGGFASMPEVDRVIGNAEKLRPSALAGANGEAMTWSDITAAGQTAGRMIGGLQGRTRAYLQVQQGCDHRCTFCIIPLARGPSRSLPVHGIIEQARHLTANGYHEVVLTGVDISSYGADLPGRPTLGGLAARLLARVGGIKRLRFSSLDPAVMDAALIELLAEDDRLMPHLHLSLQAFDDVILKRMKRRHRRADMEKLCQTVRQARPDVVFGADLIAGFPTETEAMFENTLSAVGDLGLTYLHVFPFSPRPGTAAQRMPRIPGDVRKRRAARLRAAGEAALNRFLAARIGEAAEVLVEKERFGHSRHFAPVRLGFDAAPGSIVETCVESAADGHLFGAKPGTGKP
jgi:threonylcarbamoyladenosine tRNA methylthiotransferase MtaB